MEIRRCIALLAIMHFTLFCYSLSHVQSRDVKRISGKAYLLSKGNQYEIVENVVLAKLKDGKKQVRDDIKVTKSHSFGMLEIAVPDSVTVEKYVSILEKTGDFEYVDFDTYIIPNISANDSYYNSQWGLAHIYADAAWEITTGSPSVKVAVIEGEGFDLNHPDLHYGNDTYSNLSVSEYVDYVNPGNPTPTTVHGTEVAGIIAAKTNNGIGIAGIAGGNHSEGSKIIPYRAMQAGNTISAIYDAVAKGARVINMSYNVSESSSYNQALTYAYNNGVTLVCSSGKTGSSQISYPASHEHTIAVGAIDNSNNRASFSNFGDGLDLVAPGYLIKSTVPADSGYYAYCSGTSFAAPHVSGVVALMLSVNPSLTPYKIREILRSTAKKINTSQYNYTNGWNEYVGYGLLNACAAVMKAKEAEISGPANICDTSARIYSISIDSLLSNFTVSWTINNSNFNIIPTGHHCLVSYTGSLETDYAYLTANIYYNFNHIMQLQKVIRFGTPDLGDLIFSNYYGEGNWIEGYAGNRVTVENGSSPYYNQYECKVYRIDDQFQEVLVRHSFYYNPYFEMSTVYEGWYTVYIRGINDCGYSEWSSGEIETEAPQNNGPEDRGEDQCLIIYNPDDNCLTVKWNEETTQGTYDVQVWNSTKLVRSASSNRQETKLSLAGQPKGFYIAKVIRNGKSYAKKFAIKT